MNRHRYHFSFFILFFIILLMFGDVFLDPEPVVLSRMQDMYVYFVHSRGFGVSQLMKGNLPLWNPHIYSGMPFLGYFESALLYPPNFIYLVVPLRQAINIEVTLHVFLAGLFMYLWAKHRGLHPLGCLFSSVILMFSGAYFPHVYAGHLSVLSAAAWAPLIFLAIDGLFEKPSLRWCLLGIFAVTMQILAGYPQHVFYTAIAALIYCIPGIIRAGKRKKVFLGLICICAGAAALSAVQLLTGIQASAESVRSQPMSYEFVSHFSFPPENLLTLLAPGFFGRLEPRLYWGRSFPWEASLFVSVTGLVLAIFGAVKGYSNLRRFSTGLAVILLILALGGYTPLFKVLYQWVPGFNRFSGNSKFIFQASLFISMLAGVGTDTLLRHGVCRKIFIFILLVGLLLGGASLWTGHRMADPGISLFGRIVKDVYESGECIIGPPQRSNNDFIRESASFASRSLAISFFTFLVLSILFFIMRFFRKAVYAIVLLGLIEMFVFARSWRGTYDFTTTLRPSMVKFSSEHKGDFRILLPRFGNTAMSLGMLNITGGLVTVMPGRYAEFLAFTQGQDPDLVPASFKFSGYHRLYKMLRCRYMFLEVGDKIQVTEFRDLMPHLKLISDYVIIPDRDGIFEAMKDPEFDPGEKVILETQPFPEPFKSEEEGKVKLLGSSTDCLVIEAELKSPAILLITDAYSKSWRVRALPGSSQGEYNLLPANYILRAIPLSEGYHLIRVEYLPLGFQIGKWVSSVSALFFLGLSLLHWRFPGKI